MDQILLNRWKAMLAQWARDIQDLRGVAFDRDSGENYPLRDATYLLGEASALLEEAISEEHAKTS